MPHQARCVLHVQSELIHQPPAAPPRVFRVQLAQQPVALEQRHQRHAPLLVLHQRLGIYGPARRVILDNVQLVIIAQM